MPMKCRIILKLMFYLRSVHNNRSRGQTFLTSGCARCQPHSSIAQIHLPHEKTAFTIKEEKNKDLRLCSQIEELEQLLSSPPPTRLFSPQLYTIFYYRKSGSPIVLGILQFFQTASTGYPQRPCSQTCAG